MCASKLKGTWRRRARRALVVGAISATTFACGSSLHSQRLAEVPARRPGAWRDDPLVAQALAAAAAEDGGTGALAGPVDALVPQSEIERLGRAIY